MSKAPVTFRFMTVDDVEIYRALRLRGLKETPESFCEAYEDAITWPIEKFYRFFENGWMVGGFIDDQLVGMAGLYRHVGTKVEHKGTVWGVYVVPEARGNAIAKTAIVMLVEEAKKAGLEQVYLSTDENNPFTVNLYKQLGFEPYGTEKHIIKVGEQSYVDDLLMVRFLEKEAA